MVHLGKTQKFVPLLFFFFFFFVSFPSLCSTQPSFVTSEESLVFVHAEVLTRRASMTDTHTHAHTHAHTHTHARARTHKLESSFTFFSLPFSLSLSVCLSVSRSLCYLFVSLFFVTRPEQVSSHLQQDPLSFLPSLSICFHCCHFLLRCHHPTVSAR